MNSFTSGLLLVTVGMLLGILTLIKYKLFWEFLNTRLLRKWIGDFNTSIVLYLVSMLFIIVGILLSLNIIS